MVETGLEWLVYVDDAESESTPVWQLLPNQRTGTEELGRESVNANHKGDSGWSRSLTVSRQYTISVDGLADMDDTALLYLVDQVHFGAATDHPVHVQLRNKDGDTTTFWASLESISIEFPSEEIVSYSLSLVSSGTVPAPTRA